jgi:hypothetical protein
LTQNGLWPDKRADSRNRAGGTLAITVRVEVTLRDDLQIAAQKPLLQKMILGK